MKSPYLSFRNIKSFLIISLLFVTIDSFSQGEFMHKGQSGIQFDGYYLEYPQSDQGGFGGKIGFSARGTFDMQLNVNSWSDKNGSNSGNRVYGRMVVHVLKQSDKLPFSVRGILGLGTSQGKELNYSRTETNFGVGIARRNYIRDNLSILTTVDYLYEINTFSVDGLDDVEESRSIIALTLPIAYNLPHNHLVHFAPFINYGLNDSGGSLGFNLGYIIPFYGKNN
jgi:hypothetical protein